MAGRAPAGREIAKGVCYCCKTALAVRGGRIYAAWRHVYAGTTLGSLRPSHPTIALDSRGRVAVTWDELLHGRRVVAARLINTAANGAVTFGPHEILNEQGHGVYPAVAMAGDAAVVAWTAGGSDSVVNVRRISCGREGVAQPFRAGRVTEITEVPLLRGSV